MQIEEEIVEMVEKVIGDMVMVGEGKLDAKK